VTYLVADVEAEFERHLLSDQRFALLDVVTTGERAGPMHIGHVLLQLGHNALEILGGDLVPDLDKHRSLHHRGTLCTNLLQCRENVRGILENHPVAPSHAIPRINLQMSLHVQNPVPDVTIETRHHRGHDDQKRNTQNRT
jgi:hypothetical protein